MYSTRRWWLAALLPGLALILACVARPAAAGEAAPPELPEGVAEEEEEEEIDVRVYLEEDEEAEGLLRAAARLGEQGDWRRAIRTYMEVLDRFPNTVTRVAGRRRLRRPTRDLVLERLSRLPPEALDLYRVLYDRAAKAALDRARRTMDEAAIAKVADQYFVSTYGDDALILLGELTLARGEARKALACYERILRAYPRGGEADADARTALQLRAIQAAALALGPEAARARLKAARKGWNGAELRVGHERTEVAKRAEELIAAARDAGTQFPGGPSGEAGGWPTFGVDGAHLGRATHTIKPGLMAWEFGKAKPAPPKQQYPSHFVRRPVATASKTVNLHASHATATRNRVYFASGSGVWAFEPMTGRLKWRYVPKNPTGVGMAFVTVDAGRAYAVFGGSGAVNQGNVWGGVRRGRQTKGRPPELVAFTARGGKMLWSSADLKDKEERKLLQGGQFACAPTAGTGTVYVPFVRHSSMTDAYLLAFDAATGRMVWSSFICAGFTMTRGSSHVGQPLARAGGSLYFVTDLGAAAAVDALTGAVRWIMLYDRVEPAMDRNGRMIRGDASAWEGSAPIVVGPRLLVAPRDSNCLYALSTETGEILWRAPRGKLRILLGAVGALAVCSGDHEITAFYIANGKRAWTTRLDETIVGRGYLTAECAYLPARKGLLEIDLADGRRVAQAVWPDPAKGQGNLLVVGDVLIAAKTNGLAAFFAWDQVHAKLTGAIRTSPEDPAPKLEMGDIHYKTEAYTDAIAWYLKALAQAKPDAVYHDENLREALRDRLYAAHWDRAERTRDEKPADALEDYRKAQGYALKDEERALAQFRIARTHEQLEELTEAVTDLQAAIARFGGTTCRDKGRAFRTSREAETRLWRLLKAHGREVYAAEEERAAVLLARAQAVKGVNEIEELLRLYPTSEAAEEALVLLSERRLDSGDAQGALDPLRRLLGRADSRRTRGEMHARVALACEKGGFHGMWRSQLRRIEREHAEAAFRIREKAYTGASFVKERRKVNPNFVKAAAASGSPVLRPPLAERWAKKGPCSILPGQDAPTAGAIVVRVGGRRDARGRMQPGTLQLLDLRTGKLRWEQKESGTGASPAREFRGTLPRSSPAIVVSGTLCRLDKDAIEARSLLDGKLLWRQTLEEAGGKLAGATLRASESAIAICETGKAVTVLDPAGGRFIWRAEIPDVGSVALLTDDLVVAQTGRRQGRAMKLKLVALDLATGLKRFEISLPATGGQPLAVADRLIVAPIRTGADINAYDPLTGKLVWRARQRGSRYANLKTSVLGESVVVTVQDYRSQTTRYEVFDAITGKCTLRGKLPGRQHPAAVMSDEHAISFALGQVKAGRGGLIAFDRKTGKKLWETRPPHGSPLVGAAGARDGAIAVYAEPDGYRLCFVDWRTGKVTWSKRLKMPGGGTRIVGGIRVVNYRGGGRVGVKFLGEGYLFLTVTGQKGILLTSQPEAKEAPAGE